MERKFDRLKEKLILWNELILMNRNYTNKFIITYAVILHSNAEIVIRHGFHFLAQDWYHHLTVYGNNNKKNMTVLRLDQEHCCTHFCRREKWWWYVCSLCCKYQTHRKRMISFLLESKSRVKFALMQRIQSKCIVTQSFPWLFSNKIYRYR